MWLLTLLFASAFAGLDDYRQCCASTADCPEQLHVLGPGSVAAFGRTATDVQGVWILTCSDGAAFYPAAQRTTQGQIYEGDVLNTTSANAASCFQRQCELPQSLCLERKSGRPVVSRCSDGDTPTMADWRDARLVRRSGNSSPSSPSTAARPPSSAATTVRRAEPTSPPTPLPPSDPNDFSIPRLPPNPCVPNASLRQPSREQVDLGDDAFLASNLPVALGHYRAALTVDHCNAFAWAALGHALLASTSPSTAKSALETAVRIMPQHFRAWHDLGEAREQLGLYDGAIAAYHEALSLQAGYAPSEAGLRRVSRGR